MTQPHDDPMFDPTAPPAPGAPESPIPLAITADMLAPVERRVDFEKGITYFSPLTLVLMALCIGVYIWELLVGALVSKESIINAGALWREKVLQGQIWRPVTAMFLHGGIDHLIGNCMALYVLGMANEHAFGVARTGLIYLISGICGATLSLLITTGPSVGASGAIFGLQAALVVFLYRYQDRFYVRDKRIAFVLLMWACYTILTGFLSPEIDNFCHIGGFMGGAMMGAILPGRDRVEMTPGFAILPKR